MYLDEDLFPTIAGAIAYLAGAHYINCAVLAIGGDRALGYSLVALFMALGPALLYVWLTSYWRMWMFWRPLGIDIRELVLGAVMAIIFLTITFASLTVLLVDQGVLDVTTSLLGARDEYGPSGTFGQLDTYYLWHFVAAIPLVDPASFGWSRPDHFQGFGAGLVLLAYKALVVLPVVTVLVALLKRPTAAPSN